MAQGQKPLFPWPWLDRAYLQDAVNEVDIIRGPSELDLMLSFLKGQEVTFATEYQGRFREHIYDCVVKFLGHPNCSPDSIRFFSVDILLESQFRIGFLGFNLTGEQKMYEGVYNIKTRQGKLRKIEYEETTKPLA